MIELNGNAVFPKRYQKYLYLLIICLIALVVRLYFLVNWAKTPLAHHLMGDEANFNATALDILDPDSQLPPFLYQPLYSYFLVVIYSLFGTGLKVVRIVHLLFSMATVLVFYGLGKELAGRKIGMLTALLVSLFGPLIFFEGQLLAPILVVPLVALGFWALLAANRRDRMWLLFLSGLPIGLAMMARPNMVLVLVPAAIWLLVFKWPWKKKSLGLGLALLGLIFGLLPSWIHNAKLGAEGVMVSASGGHSFYIGNNSQATGAFSLPAGDKIDDSSHQAYQKSLKLCAEQALGRQLSAAEASSYWYSRGFDFWVTSPGKALSLLGKKFLLAFNSEEKAIHYSYYFGIEIAPILKFMLSFGIVLAFAVLGLWLGYKKYQGLGLLAISAGVYLSTLMIFYVADRYRILVIPMLIPVAAIGMFELGNRFRLESLKSYWKPLAVLVLVFGFSQIPVSNSLARVKGIYEGYNKMGVAETIYTNHKKAARYFTKAIEIAGPEHGAVARTNLGLIYQERGKLTEAKELYLQAAGMDPEYRQVRSLLAELSEKMEDYQEAIKWWQELADLSSDPSYMHSRITRLKKLVDPN
jgi:4-amino-4-deoxy-L-arabinose transferase-like glycosyltransferase